MSDEDSLSDASFDNAESQAIRLAALRGYACPSQAVIEAKNLHAAVVHGIRYHEAFANLPEVINLCEDSDNKVFARARYARLIMSNVIPDIDVLNPDLFPYCIWHPDTAKESTYRELARRFPCLQYQIGRACAVAGYTTLYQELNLLPDVSIAEEAQASAKGQDIFNQIMDEPTRYAVMDDYLRKINNNPRSGANLNGDTATTSFLEFRLPEKPLSTWPSYFDIEEDRYIDEHYSKTSKFGHVSAKEIELLHNPLPLNLPAVNKDILILMAAYEGNIDRYARLRRPTMIYNEENCIVRGIYHSTSFAKWWSGRAFHAAVNARRTMVNDLSWLIPGIPIEHIPYLIWYPLKPKATTLYEIVRREPRMWLQVAHACIACNYQHLFDLLIKRIKPSRALVYEAQSSPSRHYFEQLSALEKLGKLVPCLDFQCVISEMDKEPTETLLDGSRLDMDRLWSKEHLKIYNGLRANSASFDIYMMSSETTRAEAAASEYGNLLLYEDGDEERAWDERILGHLG